MHVFHRCCFIAAQKGLPRCGVFRVRLAVGGLWWKYVFAVLFRVAFLSRGLVGGRICKRDECHECAERCAGKSCSVSGYDFRGGQPLRLI